MGFVIENGVLKKYTEEAGVTEVVIPEGVTSIGDSAFSGCNSLTSITISESVTRIGKFAFLKCSNLRGITIPEGVTSIGASAFKKCERLISITIPKSVTSIGKKAFFECKDLTSITIPESVTSIGESAFESCESLTSVTIPESVITIGENAFYVSEKIKIKYMDSIKKWDYKERSYSRREITKLDIAEEFINAYISGVKYSDEVLKDNKKYINSQRKKLYDRVKNNNEMIKYFAMEKLIALEEIDMLMEMIKNNVEITAVLLDYKDKNFSQEYIENKETDKFEKELGLKERTLTDWKKIYQLEDDGNGGYIIKSYKGTDTDIFVPNIIAKKEVTSIGEYAFSSEQSGITKDKKTHRRKITSVFIPKSVKSIGYGAFDGCESLTHIDVDENNTEYSSITGVVYNKKQYLLLFVPKGITSYVIPEGTTRIVEHAFEGCSSLTSISIPEGVTSIEKQVFGGCKKLTNITIPGSVNCIKGWAFDGCVNLSGITFLEGTVEIKDYAFIRCEKLKNITLSESMKRIGYYAFYGCGQYTITAPANSYAIEYAKNHKKKYIET